MEPRSVRILQTSRLSCSEYHGGSDSESGIQPLWICLSQSPRLNSVESCLEVHLRWYDVAFDDNSAGETADLMCLRAEGSAILVALIHCKFSGASTSGERVKHAIEVCSQAVRSVKWK